MSAPIPNAVLEAYVTNPQLHLTSTEIRSLVVEVLRSRYLLDKQYRAMESILEDRDGYRQFRMLVGVKS